MSAPVRPTRSLFDPNKQTQHQYVNKDHSDIRKTVERIRAEQASKNPRPLRAVSKR